MAKIKNKQELISKIKNAEGFSNEEKSQMLALLDENKTYGLVWEKSTESAWKMMKDYQLMKVNKGSGRAIIALTRKVARIVFAMLNNHEPFNSDLMKKSEKGCEVA